MVLDPNADRCWRYASGNALNDDGTLNTDGTRNFLKTVSLKDITGAKLLCCWITPHPSLLLSAKNNIGYYTLDIYRNTTANPILPAATNNNGAITYTPKNIVSSSLQLASIPDALIIFVRPITYKNSDPDFFYPIQAVSINFNNSASILANSTQSDLYRISKNNGLYASYEQFIGAMSGRAVPERTAFQQFLNNLDDTTGTSSAQIEFLRETGVPYYNTIPCSGAPVILEMGKDIQLADDFYAPGSLGQFNLQVTVQCYNQFWDRGNISPDSYELVILCKQSGLLSLERGTCATYQGLLTRQQVLDTSTQEPYRHSEIKRLIGGSLWDRIKTGFMHVMPKLGSITKSVLGHFQENPHARMAHDVLHTLGFGKHGSKEKSKIQDHLM
jgi:hypothetical protein